jgi:hypothetical protein
MPEPLASIIEQIALQFAHKLGQQLFAGEIEPGRVYSLGQQGPGYALELNVVLGPQALVRLPQALDLLSQKKA